MSVYFVKQILQLFYLYPYWNQLCLMKEHFLFPHQYYVAVYVRLCVAHKVGDFLESRRVHVLYVELLYGLKYRGLYGSGWVHFLVIERPQIFINSALASDLVVSSKSLFLTIAACSLCFATNLG